MTSSIGPKITFDSIPPEIILKNIISQLAENQLLTLRLVDNRMHALVTVDVTASYRVANKNIDHHARKILYNLRDLTEKTRPITGAIVDEYIARGSYDMALVMAKALSSIKLEEALVAITIILATERKAPQVVKMFNSNCSQSQATSLLMKALDKTHIKTFKLINLDETQEAMRQIYKVFELMLPKEDIAKLLKDYQSTFARLGISIPVESTVEEKTPKAKDRHNCVIS